MLPVSTVRFASEALASFDEVLASSASPSFPACASGTHLPPVSSYLPSGRLTHWCCW